MVSLYKNKNKSKLNIRQLSEKILDGETKLVIDKDNEFSLQGLIRILNYIDEKQNIQDNNIWWNIKLKDYNDENIVNIYNKVNKKYHDIITKNKVKNETTNPKILEFLYYNKYVTNK